MVVGFVGVESIVAFVRVEFVVVHEVVGDGVWTKLAYISKTESLQLCLLGLSFGQQAQRVACAR